MDVEAKGKRTTDPSAKNATGRFAERTKNAKDSEWEQMRGGAARRRRARG